MLNSTNDVLNSSPLTHPIQSYFRFYYSAPPMQSCHFAICCVMLSLTDFVWYCCIHEVSKGQGPKS